MKIKHQIAALAIVCVCAMQSAAATLVTTTSSPCSFELDTRGSPYIVTSLTPAVGLRYCAGDTVTATAPDGTEATIISAASSTGTWPWTPSSGGVWVLSDSNEGDASFVVYHSLFGLGGAGTADNPAKVVDAADFAAMHALCADKAGFTFVVEGDASIGDFAMPDGYALKSLGAGVWQLVASTGRLLCAGMLGFGMDTVKPGPNRSVKTADDLLPFAYSGDAWTQTDPTAASSLTFTSPSGVVTTTNLVGTGALEFPMAERNVWTVVLDSASTNLAAQITFSGGFVLVVR